MCGSELDRSSAPTAPKSPKRPQLRHSFPNRSNTRQKKTRALARLSPLSTHHSSRIIERKTETTMKTVVLLLTLLIATASAFAPAFGVRSQSST
jgi:hypothetical protein